MGKHTPWCGDTAANERRTTQTHWHPTTTYFVFNSIENPFATHLSTVINYYRLPQIETFKSIGNLLNFNLLNTKKLFTAQMNEWLIFFFLLLSQSLQLAISIESNAVIDCNSKRTKNKNFKIGNKESKYTKNKFYVNVFVMIFCRAVFIFVTIRCLC